MMADAIELLARRERWVVMIGLVLVTALAWIYLVRPASDMGSMSQMGDAMLVARQSAWNVLDYFLMFGMWAVMMVAMMLPGAAPMILLFVTINRERRKRAGSYVPTAFFAAGYLAIWTVFSLAATILQWALQKIGLLTPMMASASGIFGASVLMAAGLYQWTSIKDACLRHCQSPLSFIITHWRDGYAGAFYMGIRHGAYCVGCCWLLMALLFVGGVMNLLWVTGLAIFVLLEKVLPPAIWVRRLAGVCLISWGGWILVRAL